MKHLDLNLLLVFDAIYQERNVSRAAVRLHVTQSALSNALARLRDRFGDPLFIRGPGGMVPTPRALVLGPEIAQALAQLKGAIEHNDFDPTRSSMHFTVATLDYLESLHFPALLQQLRQQAPGVSLAVKRTRRILEVPETELASGEFNCALGLFPLPLGSQTGLHHIRLRGVDFVCMARLGHPALAAPLTPERLAEEPNVAVFYAREGREGLIDDQLALRGLRRIRPLESPNMMAVPFYVARTDCVAIVPRDLAEMFARLMPLQIAHLPFAMPEINVSLIWHRRADQDAAHLWLRERIVEVVTSVAATRAEDGEEIR